jgi:outer membrane protein TolC
MATTLAAAPLACAVIALFGCAGVPTASERDARNAVAAVAGRYRPGDAKPELPVLTASSTLADYMRFAALNSPRIEAAYYEWAVAVARITPARSLPDPRLTFESDVADTVMTLMPGLMVDLPGPGKLRLAGDAAAAESTASSFAFAAEILRTALELKQAYYELHALEETIRVQKETLRLLEDLETLAQQQNAAGKVTLQDVLRAQMAHDQVATRIASLEDSRSAVAAALKAALGLGPADPAPPLPSSFVTSTDEPDPDALLATALARNPTLRAMESDVRRAEAMLELARKSGVPDFSLGIEADLRGSPVVFRPSASMTLPIWRDRIAAEIAAAQAGTRAAEARLGAGEVRLAADLASGLFTYREAVRNAALLRGSLVHKARQALDAAQAGYVDGRAGFLDVIDAQRTLLEFEIALIDARTQRELSLATLSLAIAGVPPAGAEDLDVGGARTAPHAMLTEPGP